MKNTIVFVLFLLLFYIISCKVTQEKNVHTENHLPKSDKVNADSIKKKYDFAELKENKVRVESSKLLVGDNGMEYYHEDLRIIEVPNTKIIKQHSSLSEGRIVYRIPNIMKVRSTYKVLVRISKSKATVSIYDSLSGDVMTSHLPITETMEVKLIDVSPSDKKMFDIVTDDNGTQIVESGDTYTEWSWDVTPIHVGVSKLKIIVSTIHNGNKKDIVYEDAVEIERDIKEQIIFFWEEYWKWIITTFITPFFIWWWKNRKSKKKKGEEETEKEEDGKS